MTRTRLAGHAASETSWATTLIKPLMMVPSGCRSRTLRPTLKTFICAGRGFRNVEVLFFCLLRHISCLSLRLRLVHRVFKTIPEGGTWYRYKAQGEWRGKTAGGCPNHPETAQFNPQFMLAPTKPCTVFISLKQMECAGESRSDECIGFKVSVGCVLYHTDYTHIHTQHAILTFLSPPTYVRS